MNNNRIIQETPPYIRQDYVVIWSNETDAKGHRPFNLRKQSLEKNIVYRKSSRSKNYASRVLDRQDFDNSTDLDQTALVEKVVHSSAIICSRYCSTARRGIIIIPFP